MKLIPFWLVPAHWGLKGKAKKLALIDFNIKDEYTASIERAKLVDDPIDSARTVLNIKKKYNVITEFDYDMGLIKLNDPLINSHDYAAKVFEIKTKHGKLTDRERYQGEIDLMPDGVEKELKALEMLYKFNEITENEFLKSTYTAKGEYWWKMVMTRGEDNDISIELDYNDLFVKQLMDNNHPGNNEDEVIDFYVKDLGRKLATGESDDDSKLLGANSLDPKMIIHGISNGDGTTDYS